MSPRDYTVQRQRMVQMLKVNGAVHSPEVIRAMLTVQREEFLPKEVKENAYVDTPLPIGHSQTISAPHMVAMMCELLELTVGNKVLEIGTGTGYHAAVMAEIVAPKGAENPGHIYTVEFIGSLCKSAGKNLEKTSYNHRVTVIQGDGSRGLPEYAPFNRILVTAAAPSTPRPLIDQLEPSGILVLPVGEPYSFQTLRLVRKQSNGELRTEDLYGVAFVPLRGEFGWRE